MLLCISFVSCSSDDDDNPQTKNPITNLEIPQSSSDKPIKSGEIITIQGDGFIQSSEIWLKAITRSTENQDVKAEVTSVTASGISFTAPNISGERNIVLKQSGEEYSLGKMYFDDSSTSIVKKRIVKSNYDGITEFLYNTQGKLDTMKEYDLTRGGGYNYEAIFKYNNEGLLMQVIDRDAISKEVEIEVSFEYVDKLTIKVTEKQAKGGNISSYATLTLNEVGQLVSRKDEDATIKYEYDSNGNISTLSETSIHSGETIYTYKYDDKYSYLSNMGVPLWYWVYDYSNITKNYQYFYNGLNNIIECKSSGFMVSFKYDYDEDGYPTVIYDVNENNEKIGDFIYEVIQ